MNRADTAYHHILKSSYSSDNAVGHLIRWPQEISSGDCDAASAEREKAADKIRGAIGELYHALDAITGDAVSEYTDGRQGRRVLPHWLTGDTE